MFEVVVVFNASMCLYFDMSGMSEFLRCSSFGVFDVLRRCCFEMKDV